MPATRREFLATAAASSLLLPAARGAETPRKFEGIFAIPQTPFTESGAFDSETLASEIEFLHRAGAQGITWPVNASEWSNLTIDERFAGAEAIIRANKNADAARRPAVVIGVHGNDIETAVKVAKHADKTGADAILAIPYKSGVGTTDARQIEYYSAIGAASSKPFFIQAIGDISVDLVLKLGKQIPTLRYSKDEAGNTTARLIEYRKKEKVLTGVFTGKHGPNFIDDLMRGAVGNMPAAGISDLYVAAWQAFKAGKMDLAQDMQSKVLLMAMLAQNYGVAGQKYMLQLRGVFKNSVCRRENGPQIFDADAKKSIEVALAHVKPWLKA
ncbi:MAG TPA: dihydrodipicolinate synthase family protein [Bryobacteraceae bacterium]|nr:dihydrodipicolinate synthase family protein [Bryobacteraceae bacterium]